MLNRLLAPLALAAIAGCAVHSARPVFRSAVFIGDRGISVPLPPPSLIDQPKQDVDVDGSLVGTEDVVSGTVVHVTDAIGGATVDVELEDGVTDFVVSMPIDLSESCLEFWVGAPDGRESERTRFSTSLEAEGGEESIIVQDGCE